MAITNMRRRVPDHVPPECVWDHDFSAFLHELEDPYLSGGRLHEGPGILWATLAAHGQPAWIFTQHALVAEGFADHEKFSSARAANNVVMDPNWMLLPVEADKPQHYYYRRVLVPFFTPAAINARASAVQELCSSLIEGFADRGSCEFVSEFAAILPNAIVISLLGMPREMLPQFLQWEETIIHGATIDDRLAAGQAVISYLKGFIAAQKASPGTELAQAIFSGKMEDRPLNDAEILGLFYLLFVAGLDTVTSTLGWIMRHLAADQALQARLRGSPRDIPAAIEEFTRAFGVSAPTRTVANDLVFHGVPMKKGEPVLLPTFLAGRDPRAWPNPHVIDIDRKPRHVTFGAGPHVCLGIHLAKREMRVMLEMFVSRLTNIRIPEDGRVEFHTTNTIGLDRLDLAWEPA